MYTHISQKETAEEPLKEGDTVLYKGNPTQLFKPETGTPLLLYIKDEYNTKLAAIMGHLIRDSDLSRPHPRPKTHLPDMGSTSESKKSTLEKTLLARTT